MSKAEQFSRPWPTSGPWDNAMAARGFVGATGRALPWPVRIVFAGAVILLASSLWGITVVLRHPDIGIGS